MFKKTIEWKTQKEEPIRPNQSILIYTKNGGIAEASLENAIYNTDTNTFNGDIIQYRWSSKIDLKDVLLWSPLPRLNREDVKKMESKDENN